jgi:hypothetical protein
MLSGKSPVQYIFISLMIPFLVVLFHIRQVQLAVEVAQYCNATYIKLCFYIVGRQLLKTKWCGIIMNCPSTFEADSSYLS